MDESLRTTVAAAQGELLLYFPGYNNSFLDVIATTARLHSKLPCAGPALAISYPSAANLFGYLQDASDLDWSIASGHIRLMMLEVLRLDEVRNVHIVAHSIGARALTAVFPQLERSSESDLLRKISSLTIAAGDVDAGIFDVKVLPSIRRRKIETNLYVTDDDWAMWASERLHGRPRIGSAGLGLYLRKGMTTIDATDVDTSPWHHFGLVESPEVLADVHYTVCRKLPPSHRHGLEHVHKKDRLPYWRFKR